MVTSVIPLRSNAIATHNPDMPAPTMATAGSRLVIAGAADLPLPGLCAPLEALQGQLDVLGIGGRPIGDAGGPGASLRNQPGRRSQVLSVTWQPPSAAARSVMSYCQRAIGMTVYRTSNAKTRPGSAAAAVAVHFVVHRWPPFSLRPTNTAPGPTALPLRHSIATGSSASEVNVDRSVMSPYITSGRASISTLAVTHGSFIRRS